MKLSPLSSGTLALLLAGCGSLPAQDATAPSQQSAPSNKDRQSAHAAYLLGARELTAKSYDVAARDFARAVALDPGPPEYLQALLLSREHRVNDLIHQAAAERATDPADADRLLAQAQQLDPGNAAVQQHFAPAATRNTAPIHATQLAGAITLLHNASRHSYHLRGDTRMLAEVIARDYGLRATLDPDLRTASVRIDVDNVNFDQAMAVFTLLTGTMMTPLDSTTVMFAQDTIANRQRYEHLVEAVYWLPGFAADQMKDFVSIAQTVLSMKQVSVEPGQGVLLVRGPAELVDAATRIFDDLLQNGSDVVIDLKLYAVDWSHTRNLGVQLPQSLSAFSLASQAQSIVNANQSLIQQLVASGVVPSTANVYQLALYLVLVAGVSKSSLLSNSFLTFGGGATTGVLSAGSIPTINLALSQSEARTLEDVQLRGSDRQNIVFKAGTRYPIQTSLFSDIATSTAGNATVNGVSLSSLISQYLGTSSLGSSSVIPQIQYEDLGLTVAATPKIEHNNDVGMHLEVKVAALAGASLNGIPILASRQFTSDLTVHDGETAMMISNTSQSESEAVTGVPALSELPGLGHTTNSNTSRVTGDLVLMITPHIVRLGHASGAGPMITLQPRPDDD